MKIPVLFVSLLTCLTILSCSRRLISTNETRISLGTYVQMTIVSLRGEEKKVRVDMDAAYEKIVHLEKQFDYRPEGGALNAFNRSISLHRQEDELLFTLLVHSLHIAELSEGYFDPTVLPLVELWGFATGNPHLPDDQDVKESLRQVDFRKVNVSQNRIDKPIEVQFDLSGIAKGMIVDLIRDFLSEGGYKNFLINAGGDIYVSGLTKEKKKWRIAIQDPVHKDRYSGILEKSNVAIVTSGDYEQFFIEDGVKYNHLLNPKTGYPLSDLRSVTIIAEDTVFADGVATAVFIMGSERGYSFLLKNNIPGFLVYSVDGEKVESKSTPHFWD